MQQLLTLRETSERLGGRSRSALYEDMKKGRLPRPVRIGGRVYFGEADPEAHICRLAGDAGEAPMKGAA